MNSKAFPLFFVALAVSAGAQNAGPNRDASALEEWRARFGPRWSAKLDTVTGRAEMIYGGRAAWSGVPRSDDQWVARAQIAIAASQGLHGVDVGTLVADRVQLLPLGLIGSGDKWSVDLHQELGGIRVHGGNVVALFDAQGGLLSIQAQALTEVESIDTDPLFPGTSARDQARLVFEKEFAPVATAISQPVLVIVPIDQPNGRVGHLAWEVDVRYVPSGSDPVGRRFWIDARSGAPLRDEASIHFFDISGTISTMATPGLFADSATNPEVPLPVKYMRIQYTGGAVVTDVNGNFTIPGVTTPENVTLSYVGTFADVDDDPSNSHFTQAATLNPGPGNNVLLNPGPIDTVTSQANVFNAVSTQRDYVRNINAADATADHLYVGHTNIASTCNAFYDGSSINFYAAGGSCNNTAFSTVIGHEQGHWLNDLYGTGNGPDGMGEGNADVWALYVYDTPNNGDGFFTSGGYVRTGNTTRQFCGDCSPACYGQVHADGEPWMGAAWKVRANLNASLGNMLGDQVADLIFNGWLNGFNQTQIRSIIELQWLMLDDNDANLTNGTPHATDIKNGFRVQGFPGYDIEFGTITTLTDQTCEQASYPVTANVHTVQGTALTAVTLSYRVNGGAFIDVPMVPVGGDAWSGAIPYVQSPATVDYTVRALDSAGRTKQGLCVARSFFLGQITTFVNDDFETTGGWTHASVGDTSNLNDDWLRGVPQGKSGTSQSVPWADPAAAAQGTACWGNDLGLNNGNGAYQANVHSYLLSPAFDCTGQTGVQVIFKRWLTVEKSQYDIARVLANGVEVWRNPFSVNLLDTAWSTQSIDVSAVADNNSAVTIQFELMSDAGLNLGGWQVDDFHLGRIISAPACNPALTFCAGDGLSTACPCGNNSASGGNDGCLSSLGVGARLRSSGFPSVSADTLTLLGSQMPNASVLYFQGTAQQSGGAGAVFGDGLRCVAGTVIRLGTKANVGGISQYPAGAELKISMKGLVPAIGGARYYQMWYRNAATFCTSSTFNLSNGLSVTWIP